MKLTVKELRAFLKGLKGTDTVQFKHLMMEVYDKTGKEKEGLHQLAGRVSPDQP